MKDVLIELPWEAFNAKPIQIKDLQCIKEHINKTIQANAGFTHLLVGLHDKDVTFVSFLLATGKRIAKIKGPKTSHASKVRKTLLELSQLIIEVQALQLEELFDEKEIPDELGMALCLFDMMHSSCISMLDLGTFNLINANTRAKASALIQTYLQAFIVVTLVIKELRKG